MMFPDCHGQLLTGTQRLPLPERDPRCILTPDPPECPGGLEGDGLTSGRATPTCATIAGRGLFERLCEDVTTKLHRVRSTSRGSERTAARPLPAGRPRARSCGRRSARRGRPPGRRSPPRCSRARRAVLPPAEVQWQQASPDLGEPPPAARAVVSVGSLGHPHACNEACKYVKRKTGCLMGASCNRCHLCHWHRRGKDLPAPFPARQAPPPPPPAAVRPRPATTAPPLAASPWPTGSHCAPLAVASMEPAYVHVPPGAAGAAAFGGALAAAAEGGVEAARGAASGSPFPSLGSVGHPHGCGRACKYAGKASGCKVGPLCNRCHLCRWTRSREHAYANGLA
ncbi:unnamed protein product [Prorocentrum cordatum]|uniref:C3H1-type domain-containing protein n=1 Tax=Prorocentrum cordatum TaxID=2364126 RepID=A0ABN9STE6_9DINO|nr:unnamed protein product [Polarella glacialis]